MPSAQSSFKKTATIEHSLKHIVTLPRCLINQATVQGWNSPWLTSYHKFQTKPDTNFNFYIGTRSPYLKFLCLSFIHIDHLYSISSRGILNSSTAKKSSLKAKKKTQVTNFMEKDEAQRGDCSRSRALHGKRTVLPSGGTGKGTRRSPVWM